MTTIPAVTVQEWSKKEATAAEIERRHTGMRRLINAMAHLLDQAAESTEEGCWALHELAAAMDRVLGGPMYFVVSSADLDMLDHAQLRAGCISVLPEELSVKHVDPFETEVRR